ncbi:hypothetical protein ACHWQZ_G003876 [Mnemiopsis leidyi]
MNLLHLLLYTVLLLPLCCGEDGRQWTAVPRRPFISSVDLDVTPVEIQTDSRLGDTVYIEAYPEVGQYYIQISYIRDSSPLVLLFAPGIFGEVITDFNLTGPIHNWKMSKTDKNFTISCDGKGKTFDFPSAEENTWKRQVKEIKFMPFDTATTRYKDSAGTWQDLPKVRLPNRQSLYPIEFKTNNASALKQYTHITLYTSDLAVEKKVDINWDNDDYQFWIDQCNRCDNGRNYAKTPFTNVPDDIEKTWKVELTPYQLEVQCNGVKVYSYIYNDQNYYNPDCRGCTAQMNMQFEYFEFNELNDLAAVEYLAPPECTNLPESWVGVKVEPELPLPYKSRVSVGCADGYNMTSGSDIEVVCLGEDNFEFISQPVCRKDCSENKKDDDKDHDKDHDKNDNKDDDKGMLYLGVGLGAGFVAGSLIGLILYLVKARCSSGVGISDAGASYVVKNDRANVYVYRIWSLRRIHKNKKRIRRVVRITLAIEVLIILSFPIFSLLQGCHAYFGPSALSCASSNFKNKENPTTPHLAKVVTSMFVIATIGLPLILISAINIAIAGTVRYRGNRAGSGTPKSTLITLASITWVFVLSYSLAVANSVWDRVAPEKQPVWWEALVLSMMGLNVVSNPVIYLKTNGKFRNFVVGEIAGLFCGRQQGVVSSAVLSSTTAVVAVTAKEDVFMSQSRGKNEPHIRVRSPVQTSA